VCKSRNLIRNGHFRGKQRYRCKACSHQVTHLHQFNPQPSTLWNSYVYHRQTLYQLAEDNQKSVRWIQQQLDQIQVVDSSPTPKPVVAILDATFFGRGYGVLVFKDAHTKKNVYVEEIVSETISVYQEARWHLEEQGWAFQAVVIDGRRGVRQVFGDIPVQYCHFHQLQTITRYLTTRPKLEASQELRWIALTLTKTTEETFASGLAGWYERWKPFLQEKTYEESGRWHYTHRRTRSAYYSLKRNLPYLFTYQKYPEFNIPNTTNSLDGSFASLKDLLGVHRGLTRQRRFKLIREILS